MSNHLPCNIVGSDNFQSHILVLCDIQHSSLQTYNTIHCGILREEDGLSQTCSFDTRSPGGQFVIYSSENSHINDDTTSSQERYTVIGELLYGVRSRYVVEPGTRSSQLKRRIEGYQTILLHAYLLIQHQQTFTDAIIRLLKDGKATIRQV